MQGQGQTILIVDDEPEVAENLADLLEFEGYRLEMCSSGEEALERIVSARPELALVDIQLPGIDGFEVVHRLKRTYADLPVVILSASSQRGTSEKVKDCGADAFLLKPYDKDELLKLVARLLHQRAG